MKKLAIAIIAVFTLTAASAYSQMLSKGTQEFDIEGNYDELGAAGSQIWIGLGYGNFVMDNLEFIVAGAFIHNDYQTGYHPAIGVHYTINLGGKIIPFVGGNLGYGFWNNKDTEDLKGFVYGVEGGVLFFLAKNVAVDFAVDADWGSDKLWVEKNGTMVDHDISSHVGMRFYF